VNLATADISEGIPKAFDIPRRKDEFLEYANANPDLIWVQKSNEHRGIHVRKIEELDLNEAGTFVQQFVANPLLIDGRKFDIGIYTVITSVSPLRVYVYENDVLLRFCSKVYNPFDAEDIGKYVVGDNYTPTWEVCCLMNP
uniref:Tubulin tyrosine ligase n=1 Tax=Ascaris lumbricoides TaxID=6252 RepID=A0A0M3HIR6_ASCLU